MRGLFASLVRVLVFALFLPLTSSGALPFWAQLAGVEGPHVCHCSLDHHDCVCPRCDTDPDAATYLSSESLKGRCGDDELAFGGKAITVVLGSAVAVVAVPPHDELLPIEATTTRARLRGPPPTPPPQA
jgi:hypothetical protein